MKKQTKIILMAIYLLIFLCWIIASMFSAKQHPYMDRNVTSPHTQNPR